MISLKGLPDTKYHKQALRAAARVNKLKAKGGLNKVEKEQVKTIAVREDRKGDQVHEVLGVSPGANATGSTYQNYNFPGIPSAMASLIKIVPDIAQGTNREQRLGSKIQLTQVNAKFYFHIPPSTSSTAANSSFTCRLLILSPRLINKYSTLQSNWAAGEMLNRQYLRDGEDVKSFYGDLNSIRYKINSSMFVTHADKTFTLNRGQLMGDTTTGAAQMPDSIRHFNINLKVKTKQLRYSGDTAVAAENEAYFGLLLLAPNNGAATDDTPSAVWGNCFTCTRWRNLD